MGQDMGPNGPNGPGPEPKWAQWARTQAQMDPMGGPSTGSGTVHLPHRSGARCKVKQTTV